MDEVKKERCIMISRKAKYDRGSILCRGVKVRDMSGSKSLYSILGTMVGHSKVFEKKMMLSALRFKMRSFSAKSQEKEIKGIRIRKEEVKLSVCR